MYLVAALVATVLLRQRRRVDAADMSSEPLQTPPLPPVTAALARLRSLLQAPHVHAANPRAVLSACERMIRGGKDAFTLVADFDRTITSCRAPNGGRGLSCHGIIESTQVLSQRYKRRTAALFAQSYPLETNPYMSTDDKVPYMVRWYSDSHAALAEEHITKEQLWSAAKSALARGDVGLRPGMHELLSMTANARIPVTVFSAGVGDVLEAVLSETVGAELTRRMRVVSNAMAWNEAGVHTGWLNELVHMFNKDERHVPASARATHRAHALLLGDSTGDVTMANGGQHDICLRVGFLNGNVTALLPTYLSLYDVVITGDAAADFPLALVQAIMGL